MSDRIGEIFVKIMQGMLDHEGEFKKVQKSLLKEGYSFNEIEAACEWYFSELSGAGSDSENGETGPVMMADPACESVRMFTLDEETLLSIEARGFLMEMLHFGGVTVHEIERLIETLKQYAIEDAPVEIVKQLMEEFRMIDIPQKDGSEDNVDFRIKYMQ
ncbi:MAG: DUF494 family protein [Candidatus Wallbacteria bacterium]